MILDGFDYAALDKYLRGLSSVQQRVALLILTERILEVGYPHEVAHVKQVRKDIFDRFLGATRVYTDLVEHRHEQQSAA